MVSDHCIHDDVIKWKISALLALCAGNSPVPLNSPPAQRPVTRSFDVFFDLRPNKRLSKQPWGWWFETPSWLLWRQYSVIHCTYFSWGLWSSWIYSASLMFCYVTPLLLLCVKINHFEFNLTIAWSNILSFQQYSTHPAPTLLFWNHNQKHFTCYIFGTCGAEISSVI